MRSIYLLVNILWLTWSVDVATAQRPGTLIAEGEKFAAQGQWGAAAERFERAGRIKNADPELMLRAGDLYYQMRDYRRAADCLEAAKKQDNVPLVALRHARALKQCGRYEEAVAAFQQYAKNYRGERRAALLDVSNLEISGCRMALAMMEQFSAAQDPTQIERLPDGVNGPQNEYAPVPYGQSLLYFCLSDANGSNQLYRSRRDSGVWQPSTLADGLPEVVQKRYGTGTFSFDGQRFYFTQCQNAADGSNRCELFVIYRSTDGTWGLPIRLPDYINLPGTSVTHPAVARWGDREWLFFASNRAGGLGGFDIYHCWRPLDSETMDFCFPQNPGPRINSSGDDLSPHFNAPYATLTFASNGRVGMGGFDIFKSPYVEGAFQKAINAGWPLNSPADDLFFFPRKNETNGFFISNRPWNDEKPATTDQDIFQWKD